jgi:hypothetical protein
MVFTPFFVAAAVVLTLSGAGGRGAAPRPANWARVRDTECRGIRRRPAEKQTAARRRIYIPRALKCKENFLAARRRELI